MIYYGLWNSPLYRETAAIVFCGMFILGVVLYLLKQKGPPFTSAWASLKSWMFVMPLLFAAFALPKPWPLIFVTWIGVLSSKLFFQMVGMYHRSWFIWTTYLFICGLGYLTYKEQFEYFNLMPMIFFGVICLIPLLRNSSTQMIQYISLTEMAFIFWGWSYMHMARLVSFEGGELTVLYLYLLTETSENTIWACSKLFGKIRPFNKISSKVTVEGMIVGLIVTMLIAWGMRHLLPEQSGQYWIVAGLVAATFGPMGDLVINMIRRDLGIKNTGIFIIGRDGFLTRVDKLIFVGPMYFYLYWYLQLPR